MFLRKLRDDPARDALLVPGFHVPDAMRAPMAELREAIATCHKVRIAYTRADGADSERLIQPLGLVFWGETWTLGAWCELRGAFRSFRLDRIRGVVALDSRFDGDGMLARYLLSVQQESAKPSADCPGGGPQGLPDMPESRLTKA